MRINGLPCAQNICWQEREFRSIVPKGYWDSPHSVPGTRVPEMMAAVAHSPSSISVQSITSIYSMCRQACCSAGMCQYGHSSS